MGEPVAETARANGTKEDKEQKEKKERKTEGEEGKKQKKEKANRKEKKDRTSSQDLDPVDEKGGIDVAGKAGMEIAWQVDLGGMNWVRMQEKEVEDRLEVAYKKFGTAEYSGRGQRYISYLDDRDNMRQVNKKTGATRPIRRVEVSSEIPTLPTPPRTKRGSRLVERLLSRAVQVPLPVTIEQEPARLTEEEIRNVFIQHVPGIQNMFYRNTSSTALDLICTTYNKGLQNYVDTDIHTHLLSLLRFTVHQFYDGKVVDSRHLHDVAEAFTDCQAVQARVVEKVGLELQGVTADFQGLLVRLIGYFKNTSLQMLTRERIIQREAIDDGNPTHYENRLTADLGDLLGLNADDIRRAHLDEQAAKRYSRVVSSGAQQAATRCRELFDLDALLHAFVAEVNALNEDSPKESLARTFIDWASQRMQPKHIVFNEETCERVEIDQSLALLVFEMLFLEQLGAEPGDSYRGVPVHELFILAKDNAD